MQITTGMLGRAAAPAMLAGAMLAGAMTTTATAGVERSPSARGDRLLTPLGAGGATDPLTTATRNAERHLGLKAADAAGTLPLLERLTGWRGSPGDAALVFAALPRPQKPVPITRWAPLDIKEQLQPAQGTEPLLVFAAIDLSARSAMPGGSPRLSDTHRLPWAAVPKLPTLLSEPTESSVPLEIKRIPGAIEPPAPRRARRQSTQPGVALDLPFAAQRFAHSSRVKVALSHRAEPVWLSYPAAYSLPGLDPFAAPQIDATAGKPKPPAFIMPFENGRISSLYNQGRRHPAIDLAGRHGSPVFATSSGQTVIFAGGRGGYGNAVITRDKEGREHLYGHLSAIGTRVGVTLAQGDRLGALGSTGYSTGPHVHYEVKDRRGAHINPVTLLFPGRGVASGYAWSGTGLPRGTITGATAQVHTR